VAVVVQLDQLNGGSQVRIEGASGWDVTDDGRLVVVGPAEILEPTQTILGAVQSTREPVLAEFAAGTWIYAQVVETDSGGSGR
jgi:hypothetical protein